MCGSLFCFFLLRLCSSVLPACFSSSVCLCVCVCMCDRGYGYGCQGCMWAVVYLHLHANLCTHILLCFLMFMPSDYIFLFLCMSVGYLCVNRNDRCNRLLVFCVCVCVCVWGGGLRRSCGEIALTAVLLLFNYQLRQPPIPGRVGGWRRMRRW